MYCTMWQDHCLPVNVFGITFLKLIFLKLPVQTCSLFHCAQFNVGIEWDTFCYEYIFHTQYELK